jgi:hypothetical protein
MGLGFEKSHDEGTLVRRHYNQMAHSKETTTNDFFNAAGFEDGVNTALLQTLHGVMSRRI